MNAFWTFFDKLENKMKNLGAICLMGMVTVTCCDVIGRALGYPIFGSEEIVFFLMTLVIGFSLPFSHKEKIHVGVEIFVRLLSEKNQRLIKFFTDIATLGLMITITWMMTIYAFDTSESGEVSMNLELPEYTIMYALSFCFFVLCFFVLKDIIQYIKEDKG